MEDTPIYDNIVNPPEPEKPSRIPAILLNKTFRKWAYGVSAATVSVVAVLVGKPEFIAVAAPLLMALFFVDEKGEPR